MLMIIMLSLRLMTIPGDDLYHNCRCHHSSLTDVQTAATAVTDHHTDDELVHNVNRVKWHNNCNGDEVDTIVLMKTIKTIYSVLSALHHFGDTQEADFLWALILQGIRGQCS